MDAPPVEPPSRVSVVRQLEDEQDEGDGPLSDRSQQSVESTKSAASKKQSAAPSTKTSAPARTKPAASTVEPDAADMDGMPGDEPTSPGPITSPAAKKTTVKPPVKPAANATATPSKPTSLAPSKAGSKVPSKQPTPRSARVEEKPASVAKSAPTASIQPAATEPAAPPQIHAVIPDPVKKKPNAATPSKAPAAKEAAPATGEAKEESTTAKPAAAAEKKLVPSASKAAIGKKAPAPAITEAETKPTAAAPTLAAASPPPAAAPAKTKKPAPAASAAAAPTPVSAASSASPTPAPASPRAGKAAAPTKKPAAAPPAKESTKSSLADGQFDFTSHSTISQLTDQNRSLQTQLKVREEENSSMAEALLTLQAELESVEKNSGASVAKDLARKNRELNVLLSKERAAHATQLDLLRKQHQLDLEEARLNNGGVTSPTPGGSKGPLSPSKKTSFGFGSTHSLPPTTERSSDVAELESKLAQVQKGYLEKSNELSQMQAKQKQLLRTLVKEIDESLKPEEILDEKFLGKVKGRAQRISKLQDRVRELEKALAAAQAQSQSHSQSRGGSTLPPANEEEAFSMAIASPLPSTAPQTASAASHSQTHSLSQSYAVAEFHENTLARMQQDRRADLQGLKEQLEATRTEYDSLRTKYISVKARNKNLEQDLKFTREKMKALFEKSDADDKVVDQLQAAVQALQTKVEEKEKLLKLLSDSDGASRRPASGSAPSHSISGSGGGGGRSNLDAKVLDQERMIAKLREELSKLKKKLGGTGNTVDPSEKHAITPQQHSTINSFLHAESETQIQLMYVENTQLRQMLQVHEKRIAEMEQQVYQTQKRNSELESLVPPPLTQATIQKHLKKDSASSTISMSSRSKATASPTPAATTESISTLKSQLASAHAEQQLIQESYASTLASREQDIAILNEILNQKNALYLANIGELRKKFTELTAALAPPSQAQ